MVMTSSAADSGLFVGEKVMSYAYFPFYTGDYYRDTRHLSMLQHGAYRQLLDHCWDQKGPLPLDVEKCYRICGAVSKEEQETVRGIITEFFVKLEDGHYNKRVAEEVRKAEALSTARASAGRSGGLAKAARQDHSIKDHLASAKQVLASAKQVPVSPPPCHTIPTPPSSPNTEKENTGVISKAEVIRAGVSPTVARDWFVIRKNKKAPLTETAWKAILSEASKAGLSIGEAIKISAERGWQGFKASWLLEKQPASRQKTFAEIDSENRAARIREMTGGILGNGNTRNDDFIDMETDNATPRKIR
jgi:uncharacterized protein YdaU (DUF1376 family)